MDYDEQSLNSAPTMVGGDGSAKRPPVDGHSLGSMPTMPGRTAPPSGRLRPGESLLGRYTVLSELGEGGMGVVYKCLDTVGGIEVAVKCLPPELSRNEAEMEGIRENYAIVSRLHHSAISGLRQLEKDPQSGEYYLVMNLARGEDLSAILWRRRGAPMAPDEALAILRPVASALDYAHGEKVLHRDVKPGNVKVEWLPQEATQPSTKEEVRRKKDEGQVRGASPTDQLATDQLKTGGRAASPRVQLLDFGLAAEVRSSMSRVSLRGHAGSSGTPAYMAPEQWEARRQSAATDQYSLAAMAYQMLSGALPFDADDQDLLRRAVLSRPPDPVPGLPRAANAALLRALAKDPNDRFPSCTAFVEALARGFARKPHPLWPWLLVGAAAVALGVGLWRTSGTSGTGATGDESVPSVTQVTSTPPQVPPDPPVAPDQPSGGPTAVSAATPGGVATATSAVTAVTSPALESVPVLPPATATRAELEDALAQLESRRDALASQGYAAEDLERKPVEEALATLRSRIDAALEEETRKAREAELAGRRAAAQRTIDLQSLSDLKKAVERRVSSLDGTWTDGEFARRRKAIADAQRELAGCTEAASLGRAKELRGDIYDAADWIERNTPARAGLADAERSLDALVRDCAATDAARLAASALRKAERARKDAEAKRVSGRYEEAAAGYATAKSLFETARAEARAAKAAALVVEARAFGESKLWDKCLASAEKALEWDASNAAAKRLIEEAEKNLKPIWVVSAALDGKEVSGAKLTLGKQSYFLTPSLRLPVEAGLTYGPGEVTFERDGKTYGGTLGRMFIVQDWRGERKTVVVLEERRGPKPGERKENEYKDNDEDVRFHLGKAREYYLTGEYDLARQELEVILRNNPYNTDAIVLLKRVAERE